MRTSTWVQFMVAAMTFTSACGDGQGDPLSSDSCSSGGGGAALVSCSAVEAVGMPAAYCEHPTTTACNCEVGPTTPNAEPCDPGLVDAPALCCASDTWPQPGSICNCTGSLSYSCVGDSDGCECAFDRVASTAGSWPCVSRRCCAGNAGGPNGFLCECDLDTGPCTYENGLPNAVASCEPKDVSAWLCPTGSHVVSACR